MPKKKETKKDAPISKKEQELLKTQIIETVTEEAKEEIAEEVKSKITETFDEEYKEELKYKIQNEIENDIKNNVMKETKRGSRRKSFKIFRLSLYILILLVLIGYGIYRLYITDNINILHYKYKTTTTIQSNDIVTESTTTTKSKEDLIKEYSYLVDKIYITNPARFINRTIIKDLPDNEKLAIAYKSLNESEKEISGRIYKVSLDNMKKAYEKVFSSSDIFKEVDFSIDGLDFIYQENEFMAIKTKTDAATLDIKTKVIDVEEEKDIIIIKAYVAVVSGDEVYNPVDLSIPISKYTGSIDFDALKKSLKEVTFTFSGKNNNYYLEQIN